MASQLKFDPELNDAVDKLTFVCNGGFKDMFDKLAKALKEHEGSGNAYFDSMIDKCKEVQRIYNEGGYLDGIVTLVREVGNYFDLGDKLNNLTAGDISSTNVELDAARINTDVL